MGQATTAVIEAADEGTLVASVALTVATDGAVAAAGDNIKLISDASFTSALGSMADMLWADSTDPKAFGGKVLQRASQFAIAIGFWAGNKWASSAVINRGKAPNGLGLTI